MSLLLGETAGAAAGLAAVVLLATGVVHDQRDARRIEARSAALETAQNLCDRLRHGETPTLPTGWTMERQGAGPGIVLVRVRGDGVTLSTLVAAP
jgi:hypothetical protein